MPKKSRASRLAKPDAGGMGGSKEEINEPELCYRIRRASLFPGVTTSLEQRLLRPALDEVRVEVVTTRMYSDPGSVAGDFCVAMSGFIVILSQFVEAQSGSLIEYEAGMAR